VLLLQLRLGVQTRAVRQHPSPKQSVNALSAAVVAVASCVVAGTSGVAVAVVSTESAGARTVDSVDSATSEAADVEAVVDLVQAPSAMAQTVEATAARCPERRVLKCGC
jgi:hypothetical protein